MRVQTFMKAIVAALLAGLTSLISFAIADHISLVGWLTAAIALLTTFASVYGTPQDPTDAQIAKYSKSNNLTFADSDLLRDIELKAQAYDALPGAMTNTEPNP